MLRLVQTPYGDDAPAAVAEVQALERSDAPIRLRIQPHLHRGGKEGYRAWRLLSWIFEADTAQEVWDFRECLGLLFSLADHYTVAELRAWLADILAKEEEKEKEKEAGKAGAEAATDAAKETP